MMVDPSAHRHDRDTGEIGYIADGEQPAGSRGLRKLRSVHGAPRVVCYRNEGKRGDWISGLAGWLDTRAGLAPRFELLSLGRGLFGSTYLLLYGLPRQQAGQLKQGRVPFGGFDRSVPPTSLYRNILLKPN